jgi:hypothetical protein
LQAPTGSAVGLCQDQGNLVTRGHEVGECLLGELGRAGEN